MPGPLQHTHTPSGRTGTENHTKDSHLKKTDKRVRDRDPSWEGVMKEKKFPNSRKPSHQWGALESQRAT